MRWDWIEYVTYQWRTVVMGVMMVEEIVVEVEEMEVKVYEESSLRIR